MSTRWANFGERVAWTLLQVASAEAIVQGWEAITDSTVPEVWTVLLATLLAAVKNAAAQVWGSPTGATLPEGTAPVPAEDVKVLDTPAGPVAGYAPDELEVKEPVWVLSDREATDSGP